MLSHRGKTRQHKILITPLSDLLRPSCDEHPKGLAEEGGEKGIEGWWTFQERVHLVQQGGVRRQLLVDLGTANKGFRYGS